VVLQAVEHTGLYIATCEIVARLLQTLEPLLQAAEQPKRLAPTLA
jgi:hypothetical protein